MKYTTIDHLIIKWKKHWVQLLCFLMCGKKDIVSTTWYHHSEISGSVLYVILEWLYNERGQAQMRLGKWAVEKTNSCIILDRVINHSNWDWLDPQNPAPLLWSWHTGAAGRSKANAARLHMAQYLCVCGIWNQITAGRSSVGTFSQHAQDQWRKQLLRMFDSN